MNDHRITFDSGVEAVLKFVRENCPSQDIWDDFEVADALVLAAHELHPKKARIEDCNAKLLGFVESPGRSASTVSFSPTGSRTSSLSKAS